MSYYTVSQTHITLNIKVKTNKKHTKIAECDDKSLTIELAALPIEGKANKELVDFLSKHFHVPKSQIDLVMGEKWKNKTVKIPKNEETLHILEEIQSSSTCTSPDTLFP